MNKHSVVARLSLLLVSLFSSIDIGRASWISVKDKEEASIAISSDPGRAVCYIGDTYYTSLDAALDAASSNSIKDTIYVIPNLGTAVSITRSHTIEKGDSLVLPYAYQNADKSVTYIAGGKNIANGESIEETVKGTVKGVDSETETKIADMMLHGDGSGVTFADQNDDSIKAFRQTRVVLGTGKSTVNLTVEGSLLIGGKLSNPGAGVSGQTTGSYCEISLSEHAHIICSGSDAKIECDGYIKKSAASNKDNYLHVNGCGVLKTPLVIYDYRGGYYTLAVYNVKETSPMSPFYVFDFPNIQVETTIEYLSYWKCKTWIYGNGMYVLVDDLCFIGPPSSDSGSVNTILVQEGEGSIAVNYVPANFGYTSSAVDGTATTIGIQGLVSIGSIVFSFDMNKILGMGSGNVVKIDSSEFFLPISYRLSLEVKSGSTLNSSKKVKFMNGSSVTIENDATVNVTAPMAIYGADFVDNGSNIPSPYPSIKKNNNVVGASFINNGTLNVKGEGAIGGLIETTETKTSTEGGYIPAKLNYETTNYVVDSPEVKVYKSGKIDEEDGGTRRYSQKALGMLSNDAATNFYECDLANNTYDPFYKNSASGWEWPVVISIDEDSSAQTSESGTIKVEAIVGSGYSTGAEYTWSLVDNTSSDISITGSGSSATIANTNTIESTVTVAVQVSNSSGEESSYVSKDVAVKGRVETKKDIEKVVVTVKPQDSSYNSGKTTTIEYLYSSSPNDYKKAQFVHPSTKSTENYAWTLEANVSPDDYSVFDGTEVEYVWTINSNIYSSKTVYYPETKTSKGMYLAEGEVLEELNDKKENKVEKSIPVSDVVSAIPVSNSKIEVITYGSSTTKYIGGTNKDGSNKESSYSVNFTITLQIKYYKFDGDGKQTTIPSSSGKYCVQLTFKR